MKLESRFLRGVVLAPTLICVMALLSACGAGGSSSPTGMQTMADGTVMSSAQMSAMPGMRGMTAPSTSPNQSASGVVTSGPSATAKMICSSDIASAVHRNLAISTEPARHATWQQQVYTCTYSLSGGTLELSVKDLTSLSAGQAWFDSLRQSLPHASTIRGLSAFGFPAFETPNGEVAFLKDGKTLLVDATGVPSSMLPAGFSRTDVAYGIASAVIACWKG